MNFCKISTNFALSNFIDTINLLIYFSEHFSGAASTNCRDKPLWSLINFLSSRPFSKWTPWIPLMVTLPLISTSSLVASTLRGMAWSQSSLLNLSQPRHTRFQISCWTTVLLNYLNVKLLDLWYLLASLVGYVLCRKSSVAAEDNQIAFDQQSFVFVETL